jgi:hypothetical protein
LWLACPRATARHPATSVETTETTDRSRIEGRLECDGGSFTCPVPAERNPNGHAIEAISATIRGGIYLALASIIPSVNFTNTVITFLVDDPGNWPAQFVISGFSYDRFGQPEGTATGPAWDHVARCRWLTQQISYDAGPYEQAARVFRQHGRTSGAKAILIAQRRQARQTITGTWALTRRAFDATHSITVGYGYRPARVLWLLAILLILVTGSLLVPGPRDAMRATAGATTVYTTQGPLVHAEQPTRQPAHHVPGHHQGAKTPVETARSGASTRSCTPSTPSSRSYHSARERRGTPTRAPLPAPSCNGGSTPSPSSAGSSPQSSSCHSPTWPGPCSSGWH